MDEQITDLRKRRTYKFIIEAFFDLVIEKPFEKISVTDICKKAMIHRTTFYKHFEDKYQMLRFAFSEELNYIEEIAQETDELEIDYYKRVIRRFFEYVEVNKSHIESIYHIQNEIMLDSLRSTIVTHLQKLFQKEYDKTGSKSFVPIPVMAEYYAGAQIALAKWWLDNNAELSIDEMVDYMIALITWADQTPNPRNALQA